MIDTVAKRSAALQSGFSRATKVPSGTIDQIERGYTLGLYTFTYVAVSSQIWTITFATSRQKLTGGLQSSCFTGGLAVSQLTGGLAVALMATEAPMNITPPTISGSQSVGAILTSTAGIWSGRPTPSIARSWIRNGIIIAGQTGSTYTTEAGDAGYAISFRETATNSEGSASSDSNSVVVNNTVVLIYDDNFTIDRAAPITNNSAFAASGIGNTKVYAFPVDGTGVNIASGKFNFGAVTNGWVMDSATERARLAGRCHYVAFDTLGSGSFQELVFTLTAESGTLWWALSGMGPVINIKETPGSLRSDDIQGLTQGYSWQQRIAFSTSYELMIIERETTGSFSFIRIGGVDWRMVAVEKATYLDAKVACKGGPTALKSINRLCTANTSFIPRPIVQHSFASVTTPSDGSGQSEVGGSAISGTSIGSITITASSLQMSADGEGMVIFETGQTELCALSDNQIYNGSQAGIVVRYVDSSNYIVAKMDSTADTISIIEVVAGSPTVLSVEYANQPPDNYDIPSGKISTLEVHIDGNLIRAFYRPDGLHSSYTETTTTRFASATKAGVYVSKGAGANSSKASNFAVYAQVQSIPEMVNT